MASKKEMSKNCLTELKKNTEILEMTFDKAGLQVIQQSWQVTNDTDGWLDFYIEVTGDPDKIEDEYLTIKANLYDAEGEILTMGFATIKKAVFTGYETKHIMFYDDGLLFKACKSRVFAVRGYHNS